jgi:hypothetical protein
MNIMTGQRFGVGIVGLQPGRGWAVRAHVPALRALPESYEIVGVANTSLATPRGPLQRLACRAPSPTWPI